MSARPASEAIPAYPPAGLERQFYAGAIDRLVTWPLVAAGGYAGYRFLWREGKVGAAIALGVGVALLVGVVSAVVLGLTGASPGKAATGLRVVGASRGGPIGFGPALLRTAILGVAGWPTFGLGVASLAHTAVADPERRRRGWHDRVCDSIVVDVHPRAEDTEVADEVPRQVVNLTALRLAPAAAAAVPPAPLPRPTPPAVPGAAAGSPSPAAPPRHRSPAPADRTVIRSAGSDQPPGAVARWRVTFDTGESFVVEGPALVGRSPEARSGEPVRHLVPLPSQDLSLSKTHAQLQVASDGVLLVMDRGSTNGSLLVRSGVARHLSPGQPATLLSGDTVQLGDRSLTVTCET